MRHHNLQVTGSVVVNGLGLATTADLNTYTASADAKISTLQSFTASVGTTNTFTASANSRLDSIETITASNVARLNSLEIKTGSLATTGSNTFYGTQVFSGSLYVQDNLIVQGSSSLQNITASAVSIGTNIVYLNTDTPAVRYAGLTVQDSGSSAGVTGSMLWDSLCNRWIYSNPSTIGYSGGMLLSGPRTQTLGTEPTLTCNYIAKSGGGDHLYDSCIIDDGTTTCIKNNFVSTGTGLFCGQLNSITGVFGNKGGGNYGVLITDNDQSNVRLRFTNSGTGGQSMSIVGGNPAVSNSGLAIYDETAGATRLYINSSGCIGIGVACPANMLHLIGESSTPSLRLGSASITYYWDIGRENASTGDFVFINANPSTPIERMRITTGGCVGINTQSPQSLLDVQNCINIAYSNLNTLTTNQWLRLSNLSTCAGATSGILFVATGPGGGNGIATINGVTTSCGSMGITFGTRNASGAVTEKMRIVSVGTVAIGTQTSTPCTHAGANVGGLIVQGLNSCRGIIEVWDGNTSGKAVFQQVNGTTYLGNLDKGTGTGELQLMVDGIGTSATTAMTLTKCGHIVVNNAPNSQTDYGRFTISTSTPKTSDPNTQEKTVLHLSTCEADTPFGMKFQIVGGACNCTRAVTMQTGDHYISNQGNITMQVSGGNVGIGTSLPNARLEVLDNSTSAGEVARFQRNIDQLNEYAYIKVGNASYPAYFGAMLSTYDIGYMSMSPNPTDGKALAIRTTDGNVGIGTVSPFAKLTVNGTIANSSAAGNDNYTIDTMNAYQSIANGGWVDFNGMSGFLMVNNWSNGATTLFVMGGGNTGVIGTITGTAGTMHHNPGVGGYRWCQTYGATANFGFQVFRTRNTA